MPKNSVHYRTLQSGSQVEWVLEPIPVEQIDFPESCCNNREIYLPENPDRTGIVNVCRIKYI